MKKYLIAVMLLLPSLSYAGSCPLSLSAGFERQWMRETVESKHGWVTTDDFDARWQAYLLGRAEVKPDLYLTARGIKPLEEDSKLEYAVGVEYRLWCSGGCKEEKEATVKRSHKKKCK